MIGAVAGGGAVWIGSRRISGRRDLRVGEVDGEGEEGVTGVGEGRNSSNRGPGSSPIKRESQRNPARERGTRRSVFFLEEITALAENGDKPLFDRTMP
jgi:hypothetical protein